VRFLILKTRFVDRKRGLPNLVPKEVPDEVSDPPNRSFPGRLFRKPDHLVEEESVVEVRLG
jgi:hypothetical protein